MKKKAIITGCAKGIGREIALELARDGYDIIGKTGTAQKYGENGQIATGKYISSFIGTFPASNPESLTISSRRHSREALRIWSKTVEENWNGI